jgi:hypothetical protein
MNASLVRVCSGVIGGRTFGHLAGCTLLDLTRHRRKTPQLNLGDRDRECLQKVEVRAPQRELRMPRIA